MNKALLFAQVCSIVLSLVIGGTNQQTFAVHGEETLCSLDEDNYPIANDDHEPLRLDGDIANSSQTKVFSPSCTEYTFSLNYSEPTPSFFGILTTSSFGVGLSVYYLDSGSSHPFLVQNNTIGCLPVSNSRTAYIRAYSLSPKKTYSFTIFSNELLNFTQSHDYLVYSSSSKTLTATSFSTTGQNVSVAPSSTISYSSSDLDNPTSDGVARILSSGYPFSSVAHLTTYRYYNNSLCAGLGTAFRVRPNLFATCAHCLFNKSAWAMPASVEIKTNLAGLGNYDELLFGSEFVLPVQWLTGAAGSSYDYGFIIFDSDTSTERLGFDASINATLNDSIWSCGYPGYSYCNYHMYWTGGYVTQADSGNGIVYTSAPTTGGASGSPVFMDGAVIGILSMQLSIEGNPVRSAFQSLTPAFQNLYLSIALEYF